MCLNTVIFYPKSHFNEDNMKAALAVLPQRDDGVLADNGGINVCMDTGIGEEAVSKLLNATRQQSRSSR